MLSNYPKILQLYHRDVKAMAGKQVVIQEKVDGSQFQFGRYNGELHAKSKNRSVNTQVPEGLFGLAIDNLRHLPLPDMITFRGEYLSRPKHNVLTYDRIPDKSVIIFDIECSDGSNNYMDPSDMMFVADNYGFQSVPTLWKGNFNDVTQELLDTLLTYESVLGKTKIEGVVIKCYDERNSTGDVLMCKYVNPEFREMHTGKTAVPKNEIVGTIGATLNNVYRFEKAVQQLRDNGTLKNDLPDIGPLMKILNQDFDEHIDEVKRLLYHNFRKDIMKVANLGFADWYKKKLAGQFETVTDFDQDVDLKPLEFQIREVPGEGFFLVRSFGDPLFLTKDEHDAHYIGDRLNDGMKNISCGSVSVFVDDDTTIEVVDNGDLWKDTEPSSGTQVETVPCGDDCQGCSFCTAQDGEEADTAEAVDPEVVTVRDELRRHDYLYYVLHTPELSDYDYDMLFKRLQKIEEDNPELITEDSPTQCVGGKSAEIYMRENNIG